MGAIRVAHHTESASARGGKRRDDEYRACYLRRSHAVCAADSPAEGDAPWMVPRYGLACVLRAVLLHLGRDLRSTVAQDQGIPVLDPLAFNRNRRNTLTPHG